MSTIRLRQSGPYLVEDEDVRLVDWHGNAYTITRRPVALCRCGASTNKPFCDGTHSKVGFRAAEAAVPGSGDKPAGESGNRVIE
jgi:3-phenylpropionate/trans-cinnamate dioxygenase ferredoxin subunit